MARPKVAAVIQARMSSTRLPGKVLMPLAGKPVLWHLLHRLRKCGCVSVIAIATSDRPADDPLVEFARAEGVQLVRGPEDNVLQRYALAAAQLDPDIIVRVTGDAPLIDPATLDRMVETLVAEGAEYCMGQKGVPSINEGFCTCTRAALDRLIAEASDDPVAVEHVTAYFKEHPDSFRIAQLPVPDEHRFSGARLSVDTPADLRFIEEIYRRLGAPTGEAEVSEVVRLLRKAPELLEINGHIYQKKATDRTVRVVMRCDGDALCGLGHVVRCLAVADELREKHGCGITFAMVTGEPGMALVREKGFPVAVKPAGLDEQGWLHGLTSALSPDVILLDIRSPLPREVLAPLRNEGILLAVIDDPSERRLEADLAFFPPIPQVREHDWNSFTGELFSDWEWIPLRRGFAGKAPEKSGHPHPRLLVTMGGSDPAGLTLRIVKTLEGLEGEFETTVVAGSGFRHWDELDSLLRHTRRPYRVLRDVRQMETVMASADLAIASFGMTAYELAAMGVPAVYLCLTEDHARSASVFVERQIAVNCGVHDEVTDAAVASAITELLSDTERLQAMARRARAVVDGRGAERIAATIMKRSVNKHA
jgi:spore coat polysaccharide biosynthesis protein SpsF